MLARSFGLAIALSVLLPSVAYAQRKGAFPVKYVDRPLTLPKKILEIEAHVGVTHYELEGLNVGAINAVPIDLGAAMDPDLRQDDVTL